MVDKMSKLNTKHGLAITLTLRYCIILLAILVASNITLARTEEALTPNYLADDGITIHRRLTEDKEIDKKKERE